MILADMDLHAALDNGHLIVIPLAEGAIQPNSIDLRLGPELLIATPDGFKSHHLTDDGPLRLHQGMFVLGATLETVHLDDTLTAVIEGKSSRAREGIWMPTGVVDSGWVGELTLEMFIVGSLPGRWLTLGMQIGQLIVSPLSSRCAYPYGSKGVGRYQHSRGPVESRATVGRVS